MRIKSHVNELAIFGGTPAFEDELHVGRPNVPDRAGFLKRVGHILDSRRFSNDGPYVRQFEERVAQVTTVKHCVATCNGTVALQMAVKALDLQGEVIVPAMTFIATAHALYWQGIKPVFCDIDRNNFTVDPVRVEELITSRTTGILAVHLWGRSCPVEELESIASKHSLKLVFDAAHAFGCSYKSRVIGQSGNAEVFSFHATKFLHTFEGGAVVTNDDQLAARLRVMRNHGFTGYDRVEGVGINAKMHEISAAMGLAGLENLESLIAVNRRNHDGYRQNLKAIEGIRLMIYDEMKCNYQYVIIEIDKDVTKLSRDQIMQVLWAENVLARRYFFPGCHRMEPYRSLDEDVVQRLPVTELVAQRMLALPTGESLSSHAVIKVCELLRFMLEHGAEISKRLLTQRGLVSDRQTLS